MKPFFSVIIPAYNSGKKIIRCLESVYQQNFTDYEVIIINDGSTDNTEELTKSVISNKKSFRLINIKNQGVSYARNLGVSVSNGAYIVFLDSDDWVLQGYFKYSYEKLTSNSYDALIFNYLEVTDNHVKNTDNGIGNKEPPSFDYEKLFLTSIIRNNPWDKIFKRELFTDNGIEFSNGITIGEDALLVYEILLHSNRILFCQKAFVMYSVHSEGVSKSKITDKKLKDILFVVSAIKSKVNKNNIKYFHYYKIKLLYNYYMFSNENDLRYFKGLSSEFIDSIQKVKLTNVAPFKLKFIFLLLKCAVFLEVLPLLKGFIKKFY